MRFSFTTNLDAVQRDVFHLNEAVMALRRTDRVAYIPRKGESVVFPFTRNNKGYEFRLEVIDVTYNYLNGCGVVNVELHIPAVSRPGGIIAWENWFNEFRHGAGK